MKYEVKKTDGSILFEADIDFSPDDSDGVKLGKAIYWGYQNGKSLREGDYRGAVLKGMSFENADFGNSWFDHSMLNECTFDECTFDECSFDECSFDRCTLDECGFHECSFDGCTLDECKFYECSFYKCTFNGCTLNGCKLDWCTFNGCWFNGCTFDECSFDVCPFNGCTLYGCTFNRGKFNKCKFNGSTFHRAMFDWSTFDEKTLRNFKHDLWGILLRFKKEIPELIRYIKEGKIDGSVYSGECACLVGSFANIKQESIHDEAFSIKDASSPIEVWFSMIKPGDIPENNFASKMALEWIEEFLKFNE